jgi:hypothetical protein
LSNQKHAPPQIEIAAPLEQRDGKERINQSKQSYRRTQRRASAPTALDRLRRELIIECGDLIASLGASLVEAAWREDDRETEAHLRQVIAAMRAAGATFREIVPAEDGGEL